MSIRVGTEEFYLGLIKLEMNDRHVILLLRKRTQRG